MKAQRRLHMRDLQRKDYRQFRPVESFGESLMTALVALTTAAILLVDFYLFAQLFRGR